MSASQPREAVCVFGASWAQPGTPLYETSITLGAALATAGFDVVSGGYGGCMEAVSLGCARGGGAAIGVLVPSLFPQRVASGNAHLTEAVNAPTLLARIDAMLTRAPRLLVALPGTLGTLTELCAAWNIALLAPLGGYAPATLVAWREPWQGVLAGAGAALGLGDEQMKLVVFVDSVEECLAVLRARVEGGAA